MSLAGIIEGIIKSLLPSYAHNAILSMNVGLGGTQMPSNATFTQAYNFVVPLCAVMGVFCVLFIVFVGVCVWFERTHAVPDDDEDRRREAWQSQCAQDASEHDGLGEFDRNNNSSSSGGGRRRRRRRDRRGNRLEGEDEEDDAEMQRGWSRQRSRSGWRVPRQPSALFNMDPSFYKRRSSTAPSFHQAPPRVNSSNNNNNSKADDSHGSTQQIHNADPAFTSNPALAPVTRRRRSSQSCAWSQSLDSFSAAPPTEIARFSPCHPPRPQPPPQQQQRQLGSAAAQGQRRLHSSPNDSRVASPHTDFYRAPPPTHGAPDQLLSPLSSIANRPLHKKTQEQKPQQGPTAANPLAPVNSGSRAPSMRRLGEGSPIHLHAPSSRADATQQPPQPSPRERTPKTQQQAQNPQQQQQQHEQPMYDYSNFYGGYGQAPVPYSGGPYVSNYGYPASTQQDGGPNPYDYSQSYAQNSRPSTAFLPPFGGTM